MQLLRSGERDDEVAALASHAGGRVGVEGVLADLNRVAHATRIPGRASVWGFTWDREDNRSRRWWPQGIASSELGGSDENGGRSVLVTSAYSRDIDGLNKGSRLTFVDLTDRSTIRYRHVLLVEAFTDDDGHLDVRPVKIHAGGIVWHGPYVHVAATGQGLYSFRLDDVVAIPASGDHSRLRLLPGGGVDGFGYEYLLPVRFRYDAHAANGAMAMRYSFLSLDRSTFPHQLVAGEYGRGEQTTRLVRYEIDPATSLPSADSAGASRPLAVDAGVPGMQGATVVDGTYYVTTSSGRYRRGSLWVGRPGALQEIARVLPAGAESIAYWPSRDELWSLTEHPGRRYVYTMDRPHPWTQH